MHWDIHVILFFMEGGINMIKSGVLRGLENRPWFSILSSTTRNESNDDPIDQAISIAMASLNVFLINWPHIQFCIVKYRPYNNELSNDIPRWTYRNIQIIGTGRHLVESYMASITQINNDILPPNNIPKYDPKNLPDFLETISDHKLLKLYELYRDRIAASDKEFAYKRYISLDRLLKFKRGTDIYCCDDIREALKLFLYEVIPKSSYFNLRQEWLGK